MDVPQMLVEEAGVQQLHSKEQKEKQKEMLLSSVVFAKYN